MNSKKREVLSQRRADKNTTIHRAPTPNMALLSLTAPMNSSSSPFLQGNERLKPKTPAIVRSSEKRRQPHAFGRSLRVSCRKKDGFHPEFHDDAKVYCNGELVMTTGGTQKEYSVDTWSGNHPFYLGNRSAMVLQDDQVEKFRKRYGGLDRFMTIPNLKYGEIVLPTKTKSASGKGGKKK